MPIWCALLYTANMFCRIFELSTSYDKKKTVYIIKLWTELNNINENLIVKLGFIPYYYNIYGH